MYKLGMQQTTEDGLCSERPYRHGNVFSREQTSGPARLVVAPEADAVGTLLDLARSWNGDYWLLYVLLVSRRGNPAGRYQSPSSLDYDELCAFLREYGSFLASDGRHHFWIGSTDKEGLLIYDQHDVIYAYGNLDAYETRLAQRGLKMGDVAFPYPHTHCYNSENDEDEAKLIAHWDWLHFPLQAGDEY